jgi:hypothetical protein
MWGAGTAPHILEPGYFFMHLFEAACHMPPAFSQSAFVVYFAKSFALPDGLAAGELGEPLDVPGDVLVPLPDVVPELPPVPEGVPELPGAPLPLPLPV